MSREELDDFLGRERPTRLGVVGTVRRDGSPQVSPVWYRWDGERVTVWAEEGRVWVENAKRDPRVAFSVQDEGWPFPAVIVRGRAQVETGPGSEIGDEIRRITRRYVAEERVDAYVAQWAHLRTIVTIHPERISSWPAAG